MQEMSYSEILARLVSFPTVSSDSNLDLIRWIESYLAPHGVYFERIEDGQDPKASLLVRIGPHAPGGLIFSGHTDVVPVAGQPWHQDPFRMTRKGDRFVGRGVCDMKGFLACALANLAHWRAQPLAQPVYFSFSYDEEIGCDKAPFLIERLHALGARDAWVIVGEPSLLQPVVAQKGIVNLRTTVTGKSAHSSQILHQGVSAVHAASKLVTALEGIMDDLVAAGAIDASFPVAHSSLHVGIIHGGIAHNVLARECLIDWEIRNLPSQPMDTLLARVRDCEARLIDENPGLSIETVATSPVVPGLENRANAGLLDLVMAHLPAGTGKTSVAYASEAGHFQNSGFATLILGPGSIAQAHQADEWIAIEQLETCFLLLRELVAARCLTPLVAETANIDSPGI